MAPIRPDHYEFAFDSKSLSALRGQIGLTQAVLADLLDVPVNTVSRWETGATTPDAKALAAIYSIAKANGVTPKFFKRNPNMTQSQNQRTQLLLVWDFQNHGLEASEVETEWQFLEAYFAIRFPKAYANLRKSAYATLNQYQATQELQRLGFRVSAGMFDADSQIVKDVQLACQSNPSETVLFLVTDDGNFSDLLVNLIRAGVEAYVLGTDECSERLRKSVGREGFVHWDAPYVVTECVEVIKELGGKPITKAEFGNRCRNHLNEDGIFPDEVGFSRRNPYGSVLRWLEVQGIVTIAKVPGKGDAISIRLVP